MEKILLKPIATELLFRTEEPNTHFDVLSYSGTNNQEKSLGSLFFIGHVKYEDEDLSYVVNLISSLAKREYYSEQSLKAQDPRKAFEGTLRKLNEVLEDFFKHEGFKLNIGIAAIAGDSIYISRLGKFKVGLARNHQYVDVLNNVVLFEKAVQDEQQFSNIISGKLYPGDKLFAYFPSKAVTLREKTLQPLFVKEGQETFTSKVAELADRVTTFSCCGIHIAVEQIKEIPIQTPPRPIPLRTTLASQPTPGMTSAKADPLAFGQKGGANQMPQTATTLETGSYAEDNSLYSKTQQNVPLQTRMPETPKIIAAEMAIAKRSNIVSRAGSFISRIASFNSLTRKAKIGVFLGAVIVICAVLFGVVLIRKGGQSNTTTDAYKAANQNYLLAQAKLGENDSMGARTILESTLAQIFSLQGDKIDQLKQSITSSLDSIDHVDPSGPSVAYEFTGLTQGAQIKSVAQVGEAYIGVEADTSVIHSSASGVTELGKVTVAPQLTFGEPEKAGLYASTGELTFYTEKTQKLSTVTLQKAVQSSAATAYEDNLYVFGEGKIYKYTDALKGETGRALWSTDVPTAGNVISMTVDGTIYALTDQGLLVTYFKGKKTAEHQLLFATSPTSMIFTAKDSDPLYIADAASKKVFLVSKTDGALIKSYKLDTISSIVSMTGAIDGGVLILSSDNKVWLAK